MNEFTLGNLSSDASLGDTYAFSRNDKSPWATLMKKEGLFSKGIGKVEFTSRKLDTQSIINFKLARQQLQPQPHSKEILPDLDVEGNMAAIEKQNLLLSLLVDRLNDSESTVQPTNTSFVIGELPGTFVALEGIVDEKTYKQLLNTCRQTSSPNVPSFELRRNDGTGNYRLFATVICLPNYTEPVKTALIDAVYVLERALKHVKNARRSPPEEKYNLGGAQPA